jgi:hypothetical protein
LVLLLKLVVQFDIGEGRKMSTNWRDKLQSLQDIWAKMEPPLALPLQQPQGCLEARHAIRNPILAPTQVDERQLRPEDQPSTTITGLAPSEDVGSAHSKFAAADNETRACLGIISPCEFSEASGAGASPAVQGNPENDQATNVVELDGVGGLVDNQQFHLRSLPNAQAFIQEMLSRQGQMQQLSAAVAAVMAEAITSAITRVSAGTARTDVVAELSGTPATTGSDRTIHYEGDTAASASSVALGSSMLSAEEIRVKLGTAGKQLLTTAGWKAPAGAYHIATNTYAYPFSNDIVLAVALAVSGSPERLFAETTRIAALAVRSNQQCKDLLRENSMLKDKLASMEKVAQQATVHEAMRETNAPTVQAHMLEPSLKLARAHSQTTAIAARTPPHRKKPSPNFATEINRPELLGSLERQSEKSYKHINSNPLRGSASRPKLGRGSAKQAASASSLVGGGASLESSMTASMHKSPLSFNPAKPADARASPASAAHAAAHRVKSKLHATPTIANRLLSRRRNDATKSDELTILTDPVLARSPHEDGFAATEVSLKAQPLLSPRASLMESFMGQSHDVSTTVSVPVSALPGARSARNPRIDSTEFANQILRGIGQEPLIHVKKPAPPSLPGVKYPRRPHTFVDDMDGPEVGVNHISPLRAVRTVELAE